MSPLLIAAAGQTAWIAGDGFAGSSPSLWFGLMSWGPMLFIVGVWIIAAVTISYRGGDVDKQPNRVPQLYGYTVCLVAIIASLLSVSSLLDAAFDRANPLQSEYGFGASLTTFETYRATYRREAEMFSRAGAPTAPDTASEATLRRRYDALVAERVAATRYRTAKALTTSGALLLIAIALFMWHWRWVRRMNGVTSVSAAGI